MTESKKMKARMIYLLSVHTFFCECLLSVNICQPVKETHLKSEKSILNGFPVSLELRSIGEKN